MGRYINHGWCNYHFVCIYILQLIAHFSKSLYIWHRVFCSDLFFIYVSALWNSSTHRIFSGLRCSLSGIVLKVSLWNFIANLYPGGLSKSLLSTALQLSRYKAILDHMVEMALSQCWSSHCYFRSPHITTFPDVLYTEIPYMDQPASGGCFDIKIISKTHTLSS